jgi:sodium/hydrogen antiporter
LTALYIVLAVTGGMVLVLGLFSGLIKNRSMLSDPLIALLVGIALGSTLLDVLDPAQWGSWETIVEETARVTLAIGLMAVALRLPAGYVVRHWRSLAVLLGLVMPLMWAGSSVLAYVFLDLSVVVALLVGAIVTPTDPVVASSIVTSTLAKEQVPERVRHLLSAESGANDGLAYLFVLLPFVLLTQSPKEAFMHWFTSILLWEVGGTVVLGIVIGYSAGRLLAWAEAKHFVEKAGFLSVTIALALLTLGSARLLGTDGILAVFVAGIAFDAVVSGEERAQEANIQETVNQFFSIPIFALLGLVVPVEQWLKLGWRGLALAAAILLLRRLPAVVAVRPWLRSLHGAPDLFFLGWFGPIGVSALLYATLALHRTGDEATWAISSLVICMSIAVHGMTATPLTKRYGRRAVA